MTRQVSSRFVMGAVAAVMMVRLVAVGGVCQRTPIVFNFGDSNSDTGGNAAVYGNYLGWPSGRKYFGKPTGRVCDGRLVIDFLCSSLEGSFLSPYLEALGSNFTNGANFAIAGACAEPQPQALSLRVQTREFSHFHSRSLQLSKQGLKDVIDEEGFKNAIYTFDIGQNDLSGVMGSNLTYTEKEGRIPIFLNEIRDSVMAIYTLGGRNFWIHNTGPLGCLPQKLAEYHKNTSDLDAAGCLAAFNDIAKVFNAGLDALCDELRGQLKDATIVYNDVYTIKYDIISNYIKYGFEQALMACCGHGGPPYNYDRSLMCLAPGFSACSETARFVSWDGIHYAEAANELVATMLLSTAYSKPRVRFQSFCGA